MIYQMVGKNLGYSSPNISYQQMLEDGYEAHGLDLNQIYKAEGFTKVEDNLDWYNHRSEY